MASYRRGAVYALESSLCAIGQKELLMLGFIFGFNARLGRMHFFLATIGLAVVMTAICFAVATSLYQSSPHGMPVSENSISWTWPLIGAGLLFAWATFTLQSMRIRDIGWDPVCVIPAWIAVMIVDKIVADKIPTWAIDRDHDGTIAGAAVNLVFFLALSFWPGGDFVSSSAETPRRPDKTSSRSEVSIAAARRARIAGGESVRGT
jgi:uncharacterized membrane protein YhaH (DUF805 family)